MSKQYMHVKDITIASKGWTSKVIVEAKGMPCSSQRSLVKYQRMILRDTEGTKVQTTIFDSDIKRFSNVLTLYKSYYISNAVVKTIPPQHRIANNDYQWHINSKTVVEEVPEEHSPISLSLYNFVPFSEIHKYIKSYVHVGELISNIFLPSIISATLFYLIFFNNNFFLISSYDRYHWSSNRCTCNSTDTNSE
ncbi:hypothetical protein UlMin_007313 [Ulmus minor]